jgi:hypothetical protein
MWSSLPEAGRWHGLRPPWRSERESLSEELLRRLQTMAGVHLGKGGKPEGARNPIKIKSGEKTLSEIVLENRR